MTEEQARTELAELAGPVFRLRESKFDHETFKHTGMELVAEYATATEAFWGLVTAAGQAGALASAETMEHLRWRLVEHGYESIFCNGFEITREAK